MVIYCCVLVNSHIVPWNCGQPGEIVEFKTKAQQLPRSLFMCIQVHAQGGYMGWLNNNNILCKEERDCKIIYLS